jgi:hypothetical protein
MGLPVKAPPPPAPPPSNWYGFIEFDFESELVNPNGMALSGPSETVVAGLGLNLYNNKAGFINNWKIGVLTALDFTNQFQGYWTPAQNNAFPGCCNTQSQNGNLFDAAFILETAVTFGQYWTLTESYINAYSLDNAVLSGPGGAGSAFSLFTFPSGFPTLIENDLKLSLNDSFTGWPITFNPYVTFAYYLPSLGGGASMNPLNVGTVSAIGFEGETNAYNFFIGATPTFDAAKYWGVPLTFKAPMYVTVGPSSTWNGLCSVAPGNVAGAHALLALSGDQGLQCSSGDVGIFTIGLTAIWNMSFIPASYGHWYLKGGFQWYDLVNNAVRAANQLSVGPPVCGATIGACNTAWSSAPSDIIVGFVGVGVAF